MPSTVINKKILKLIFKKKKLKKGTTLRLIFVFVFVFFKTKKYINFNIFLLITVEGILVFKQKLTPKNGIFHPS
jgi:hypothetical protein